MSDSLMTSIDDAIRAGVFHSQSLEAIATYLEVPLKLVRERYFALRAAGEDFVWKPEYGVPRVDAGEMLQ